MRKVRDVPQCHRAFPLRYTFAVALLIGGAELQAQRVTILYSFTGAAGDGAIPYSTLVADPEGNLYGTTEGGGQYGWGTIFKLDPSGYETVLYSFTNANGDGAIPESNLIFDQAGDLYGTTLFGGTAGEGTVFKLDPGGNEMVLYSFLGGTDGANPVAGLLLDAAGNLWGTCINGGSPGNTGTVFKLAPSGAETVVYRFPQLATGLSPQAALLRYAPDTFVGTAAGGGASGNGVVFEISSGREIVLHSFANSPDGRNPAAPVIADVGGNLYGTTDFGGIYGLGSIFEIDTAGEESIIHSFGLNGHPWSPNGVLRDQHGNFYGMSLAGGTAGLGTVFKIDSAGNETYHSFTGQHGDGASPFGGLIHIGTTFYGTTGHGGVYGQGTIFKVTF
jgi:uncharacterized repeat protein (TIGR03803 family)